MSLLGLLSWGMYGALSVADGVSNNARSNENRQKAIDDGEPAYYDAKGNMRLVSDNRLVTRQIKDGFDVLVDLKTFQVIYSYKKKRQNEAWNKWRGYNEKAIETAKELGYRYCRCRFSVIANNAKNSISTMIKVYYDLERGQYAIYGGYLDYFKSEEQMREYFQAGYQDWRDCVKWIEKNTERVDIKSVDDSWDKNATKVEHEIWNWAREHNYF